MKLCVTRPTAGIPSYALARLQTTNVQNTAVCLQLPQIFIIKEKPQQVHGYCGSGEVESDVAQHPPDRLPPPDEARSGSEGAQLSFC